MWPRIRRQPFANIVGRCFRVSPSNLKILSLLTLNIYQAKRIYLNKVTDWLVAIVKHNLLYTRPFYGKFLYLQEPDGLAVCGRMNHALACQLI